MIKINPNLYKLPKSEIKQYGEQNLTYKYPENIRFLKKATYIDTILTETTWIMHEIHLFII